MFNILNNEDLNTNSLSNDVEFNSYGDFDLVNSFYGFSDYYTKDQLLRYIFNPMYYHKQLMEVSEKMFNKNGIYGQTVNKMVAAPSLDAVIIPNNINVESKKNIDKAYNIFDNKINHKLSTRDIIFNSLLYGEYIAVWRDTKKKNVDSPKEYATGKNIEGAGYIDNVMLQPLDLKFCRFDGFANGDYVVSYDMQYFDMFQGSNGLVGEIKNYPKEFITGYIAYKKDTSKRWMQLSQKTTFAYKYHGAINESHGRPLAIFALLDMLFSDDYTDSQRNNMYENSSNIRWMELPPGEKTGSCSLNKDQQKNQYNAFKDAVKSNDTKQNRLGGTTTLKLAPGTKIGKLENNDTFLKNTLTEENNTAISTDLGFALSALNGTGDGASYSTLQVNIDLMLSEVFSILEQISFQYSKLINYHFNLSDNDRLNFIYLNTSSLNAESQFEKFKDLYTLAGGSRTMLYSSACGNANLYMKLMDFESSENFDQKYLPHITSFTATDKADNENPDDNLGGRPEKKDKELSNNGQQTRNNNSNAMSKPSTKK